MRKTERKRKPLMLSYLPPSTAMDSISYFPPNPTSQPKPNLFQNPPFASDRQIPLFNLSILRQKIDSLRRSLSQSLDSSSPIAPHQIDLATSEIVSAVHQIIINGAALIASSQDQSLCPEIEDRTVRIAGNVSDVMLRTTPNIAGTVADPIAGESARMLDLPDGRNVQIAGQESEISRFVREVDDLIAGKAAEPSDTRDSIGIQSAASGKQRNSAELRTTESGDGKEDGFDANTEVVELDMVELLVEHVHFCSICGKGFKRDANLRMHMRAHGNQFKTVEALVKPDKSEVDSGRKIRFSCPFSGCNRNQSHKRFRPLKSALCVKNHFKRSHCPKMYSCSRCNKKSFSVLADLKSHLKHCGECRWRCSCGTTFSRKDKLLGHVTLFDGHMPVVVEDKSKEEVRAVEEGDEGDHFDASCRASDFGLLENVFEGFDSTARGSFEDVLGFL